MFSSLMFFFSTNKQWLLRLKKKKSHFCRGEIGGDVSVEH